MNMHYNNNDVQGRKTQTRTTIITTAAHNTTNKNKHNAKQLKTYNKNNNNKSIHINNTIHNNKNNRNARNTTNWKQNNTQYNETLY